MVRRDGLGDLSDPAAGGRTGARVSRTGSSSQQTTPGDGRQAEKRARARHYHHQVPETDRVEDARRILVYGATGSGKTVMARRLSELTGIPWTNVDDICWSPGWVQMPQAEQVAHFDALTSEGSWLLDSAYGGWRHLAHARADLVVALDYAPADQSDPSPATYGDPDPRPAGDLQRQPRVVAHGVRQRLARRLALHVVPQQTRGDARVGGSRIRATRDPVAATRPRPLLPRGRAGPPQADANGPAGRGPSAGP